MIKPYRIVAISDTHEKHEELNIPECDLLIHAGDITNKGHLEKILEFDEWCNKLKATGVVKDEIVVIAGNHDKTAQIIPDVFESCLPSCKYLCDSSITVGYPNMKPIIIYGSPWTPSFFKEHFVFNADRGEGIRSHWNKITQCDILVTHGPPWGVRDFAHHQNVGCADLREKILQIKPRLHVCGHIHEGYGIGLLETTVVFNAASCKRHHSELNAPLVIDWT